MSVNDEYLPELVAARAELARLALADARRVKFQTADFGGTRTEADTVRILKYRDDDYAVYAQQQIAAGKPVVSKARFRPIAPFGESYHNFMAAFDAGPTEIDGVAIHKRPTQAALWRENPARAERLYQEAHDVLDRYAAAVGLVAGDSFQNPDEPHFQLAITLEEARRRWTLYKAQQTREDLSPRSSSSSPSSSASSSPDTLPGE